MTFNLLHFVDPTIPGLSGRDLAGRAEPRLHVPLAGRVARPRHAASRSPARVARDLLRDLGLDRDVL